MKYLFLVLLAAGCSTTNPREADKVKMRNMKNHATQGKSHP